MSIIFEKDGLTIRIDRNGGLSFPGYDEQFQYDVAFTAMGGGKTPAAVLLDRWERSPTEIMCHAMNLPREVLIGLAADWAEHVLHVFEGHSLWTTCPRNAIEADSSFDVPTFESRSNNSPRQAIEAARLFAASLKTMAKADVRLAESMIDDVVVDAERVYRIVRGRRPSKAVLAAYWVARCVGDGKSMTAKRATHVAAQAEGSVEDKYVERAWQIRRFVDVLEALKAGKPWPPLEATT